VPDVQVPLQQSALPWQLLPEAWHEAAAHLPDAHAEVQQSLA
jgi:hypothetical protein